MLIPVFSRKTKNMVPALFNWSGGKDSSLALYYILQEKKFDVKQLLTTISSEHQRITMHGVRRQLLEQQATQIGIPLICAELSASISIDAYNTLMHNQLESLRSSGIETSIFGDIFLEDLKLYRENQLKTVGMRAVFPLWLKHTTALVEEFIDLGFKAIIVCCDDKKLGAEFCGQTLTKELIKKFPDTVDPAGENGEYHTFVYDGPIFKKPIDFKLGEKVIKTYPSPTEADQEMRFWFQDLLVV